MTDIAVIVGSTRPGRRAATVARWAQELLQARHPGRVDIVDLADVDLPLLGEPLPARAASYSQPHTRRWARTVASYDAFVFVTPEYNHSFPGALKNAIDFLYAEWNDKAAGFIGYGAEGGARAVEHLRQVLAEVRTAGVGRQVCLTLADDFEDYRDPDAAFTPRPHQAAALAAMADELVAWAGALGTLRETRSA